MQKNEKNSLEIHTYVLEAFLGCFTDLNGRGIIIKKLILAFKGNKNAYRNNRCGSNRKE